MKTLLSLVIFSLFFTNAFALNANCKPLVDHIISKPGCYFLNADMYGPITINASSVTLDLNDKTLRDPNPDLENVGINLNANSDITVRNGFFNGFWIAITGVGVHNTLISHNTFIGTKYIGVNLTGEYITIRNNHFTNMDFKTKKTGKNFYIVGINIRDYSGCEILNNVISATNIPSTPLDYRLEYVGIILLDSSKHCKIRGNVFNNLTKPLFRSIVTWIGAESDNNFSNNLLVNFTEGLICRPGTCTAQNNQEFGVDQAFTEDFSIPPQLENERCELGSRQPCGLFGQA